MTDSTSSRNPVEQLAEEFIERHRRGEAPFSDPVGFLFDGGPVVSTGGFNDLSARHAKENITPISDALEKIRQLQGVYFDWKAKYGGRRDIGLIAEEVAKVLPELVTWENDGQSAQGLNYGRIVAVTIEGVKAQQNQIDRLEAENAALKQNLASWQDQMAELSAQVAQLSSSLPSD